MKVLQALIVSALGVSACLAETMKHIQGPQVPERDTARARMLSDVDILSFALDLENLEVEFYRQALNQNFTRQDFAQSHLDADIYDRFRQILENEETHRDFLSEMITEMGGTPPLPCQYNFGVSNLQEFMELAHIFESAGTSAYSFAVGAFQDPRDATIAASMLGLEARQAAWIGSVALGENPWNTAFEAPLSFNKVITLARPFIVACPVTNGPSIATPFPQLRIRPLNTDVTSVRFSFSRRRSRVPNMPLYAAFIQGSGVTYTPINMRTGQVEVPTVLKGLVWVLVTSRMGSIADEDTVAGPAPMQVPFDAQGRIMRERIRV